MMKAVPLSFKDVDGLGFAAVNDVDIGAKSILFAPNSLGPLLELLHLDAKGRLPVPPAGVWLASNGATPMIAALREKREWWSSPQDRRMGFLRAKRRALDGDNRLVSFLMNAQTAARVVSGLAGSTPSYLAAAMEELENNIHEHSDDPETGIVAYRAVPGTFEFVVADHGVGVLESLRRCAALVDLPDDGKALETALTDGTSRFGIGVGRGHGFRPIFLGLANLQGSLRFRSGDHALIMDGSSPNLTTAQLLQKPPIDGFFTSIRSEAVGRKV